MATEDLILQVDRQHLCSKIQGIAVILIITGLFYSYHCSGMPSFPHVGTAQQLLSNPMVTQAAVNYGQGLVDMGQSYIDRSVCVCMSIVLNLQEDVSFRLGWTVRSGS